MNLKETYWTLGNILVLRSKLAVISITNCECYIIKDDNMAYPCNQEAKIGNKWWYPLSADMYNDELRRTDVSDDIRDLWDVVSIYSPVDEPLSMTQWTDGNILMTRGELFFGVFKGRALGLNNDGGWLEQADFDDSLQLKERPQRSWSIAKVFKEIATIDRNSD